MTECFELIDRKLLKGPWVIGEQYTICDRSFAEASPEVAGGSYFAV
jgi:glutathione S-transferase